MPVDVGQDIVYLGVVGDGNLRRYVVAVLVKGFVQEYHKLGKGAPFRQVAAETVGVRNLVYQVDEAFAHLRIKMEFMGHPVFAVGETMAQIRVRGGKRLEVIGKNGNHDSFMHPGVHLCQIVAFVLVNEENIARLNIIETVID